MFKHEKTSLRLFFLLNWKKKGRQACNALLITSYFVFASNTFDDILGALTALSQGVDILKSSWVL